MPEEFIYSGRVSPGIHLVLVYDPLSKELFKKVITVMPRDDEKDYDDPPELLDHNTYAIPSACNLIDNSSHRDNLSKAAFKHDINHPSFNPHFLENLESSKQD